MRGVIRWSLLMRGSFGWLVRGGPVDKGWSGW